MFDGGCYDCLAELLAVGVEESHEVIPMLGLEDTR